MAPLRYYDGVRWTTELDRQPVLSPARSESRSTKVRVVAIAAGVAVLLVIAAATNQIHFSSASANSSPASEMYRDRIANDLSYPVGVFLCQDSCVQDGGGNPYLPSTVEPGRSLVMDMHIFSQSRVGVESAAGVWIGCLFLANLTTGVTQTVKVSAMFSTTQQTCTTTFPPARAFP